MENYKLGKRIGRGNYGTVYVALDRRNNRWYCLKTIVMEAHSDEEREKAQQEVEVLQGQKDAVTEMLVQAHQQLAQQARLSEELAVMKAQHAAAVEQLQLQAAEAARGVEREEGAAERARGRPRTRAPRAVK